MHQLLPKLRGYALRGVPEGVPRLWGWLLQLLSVGVRGVWGHGALRFVPQGMCRLRAEGALC